MDYSDSPTDLELLNAADTGNAFYHLRQTLKTASVVLDLNPRPASDWFTKAEGVPTTLVRYSKIEGLDRLDKHILAVGWYAMLFKGTTLVGWPINLGESLTVTVLSTCSADATRTTIFDRVLTKFPDNVTDSRVATNPSIELRKFLDVSFSK